MSTKRNKTKKPTRLSPQQVRTYAQRLRLRSDNHDSKHGWILLDGGCITLAEQATGEDCKGKVTLPRREFDRLIAWYLKPQRLTK